MPGIHDGPSTSRFKPLIFEGTHAVSELPALAVLSEEARDAAEHAPTGACVSWGIPFEVGRVVVVDQEPVTVKVAPTKAAWLVFLHTSDLRPRAWNEHGFLSPMHGQGMLSERAADYVVVYADGSEERLSVRRRHQLGAFSRRWGENCFQAVAHHKHVPVRAHHEQMHPTWGRSQMRADSGDASQWVNWLWAWENPQPDKAITSIRLEPASGSVILSAISAGSASSQPLRWLSRRKALLALPAGEALKPDLDEHGLLEQIQLDMGQVISASPRPVYPNATWSETYNNRVPEISETEVLVEYTAHPDASFHLSDGRVIPVADVVSGQSPSIQVVTPATQRVTLRAIEKTTGKAVPVKLHVHGETDEYLPPIDRHRIPNPAWFEDYSVDFVHLGSHYCTYIDGQTEMNLPLGRVYLEVSKGFEIKPVRMVAEVTAETDEIIVEIEKVLPWRERGWVSADTHVHFLSPITALVEGSAEGVNIVNLLASQWGELMTNVGDFDGRNTWGSRETGGDGEYLVRVGTENRQHVMGHISLLGYSGRIIAPMTTGGPNESAIGDPIEVLLTEWARQCHKQGGLVIVPHFPNPRAEHVASIVEGDIDGVEMTAWGNLYSGIDPYSLSDWYRYLNCGYLVAAVGGTDKMSALTPVGAARTYARIPSNTPFTYDAWMEAVKRADTFVSYGPMLEFAVDGQTPGSRIQMSATGGTVDVTWELASVTVPMSRVELVVNGEIRESLEVDPWRASGSWSAKLDRSSWLALLVRGHYADKPEMIAAHSSPVMVEVAGSPFFAAADAVTILEQVEGALAYMDTVGTRAEDRAYKRMRLVLQSAHRKIHNQLHRQGNYHEHTAPEDHAEHR